MPQQSRTSSVLVDEVDPVGARVPPGVDGVANGAEVDAVFPVLLVLQVATPERGPQRALADRNVGQRQPGVEQGAFAGGIVLVVARVEVVAAGVGHLQRCGEHPDGQRSELVGGIEATGVPGGVGGPGNAGGIQETPGSGGIADPVLAVVEVQVAIGQVQHQTGDGQGGHLQLGPLQPGLAGVGGDGGTLLEVVDLHVGVVIVEDCSVDPQATAEPVRLQSQLVVDDFLRVGGEPQSLHAGGPDGVAARGVAGGHLGVDAGVGGGLGVGGQRGVEVVEAIVDLGYCAVGVGR